MLPVSTLMLSFAALSTALSQNPTQHSEGSSVVSKSLQLDRSVIPETFSISEEGTGKQEEMSQALTAAGSIQSSQSGGSVKEAPIVPNAANFTTFLEDRLNVMEYNVSLSPVSEELEEAVFDWMGHYLVKGNQTEGTDSDSELRWLVLRQVPSECTCPTCPKRNGVSRAIVITSLYVGCVSLSAVIGTLIYAWCHWWFHRHALRRSQVVVPQQPIETIATSVEEPADPPRATTPPEAGPSGQNQ
jgi:hypothetical protein